MGTPLERTTAPRSVRYIVVSVLLCREVLVPLATAVEIFVRYELVTAGTTCSAGTTKFSKVGPYFKPICRENQNINRHYRYWYCGPLRLYYRAIH